MRSSAQACEDLLARLFTDAEFRARFRADPQGIGRELGLDEAALAALERTKLFTQARRLRGAQTPLVAVQSPLIAAVVFFHGNHKESTCNHTRTLRRA
jgi:hypothetical protein